MDCDVVKELLPAYVDGELDAPAVARLHMHIDGCAGCAAELRELRAVHALVAAQATRHRAPPELRARVMASLAEEAARGSAGIAAGVDVAARAGEGDRVRADAGTDAGARAGGRVAARIQAPAPRRWQWRPDWLRMGGASLASAACAVLLTLHFAAPTDSARISEDIVESHFRSLQVDHLTDVASTDQHTVKPWFAGKLDFSPPVYDLAPQGFSLIGGRLEYLGQRNVAALAYRHRQHLINMFVWPDAAADAAPHVQTRQGIHLLTWRSAGMRYWLVSDVGAQDLDQLAKLVQARVAANDPQ